MFETLLDLSSEGINLFKLSWWTKKRQVSLLDRDIQCHCFSGLVIGAKWIAISWAFIFKAFLSTLHDHTHTTVVLLSWSEVTADSFYQTCCSSQNMTSTEQSHTALLLLGVAKPHPPLPPPGMPGQGQTFTTPWHTALKRWKHGRRVCCVRISCSTFLMNHFWLAEGTAWSPDQQGLCGLTYS